ncbi:MAG: Hsp20/alpha crystallin family protein [Chloroflexi bacterium]|nr:MAG: Hsp20/alpha crystallin family protein [Chloroflexota bacterium]
MSILRRREPSGDLVSLRSAVDRLLEESFIQPFGMLEGFTTTLPAVDMYETGDAIMVKAALPGVKPENVEITTVGNTLTIKGETKEEAENKQGDYFYQEQRYGSFCRSFTLPTDIKADKAQAEFENGVLTLTLPKAEEAKRKSIKIKSK